MSRTRNQRRRERIFEQIVTVTMLLLLLVLMAVSLCQCRDSNELQERRSSTVVTVMREEDFLPQGFDPSCPEYQAALRRYDIEHGYIIPEQKEPAPEAATSEAADTEKSAS